MTTDEKIFECNVYLANADIIDPKWREMITEYKDILINKNNKLTEMVAQMKENNRRWYRDWDCDNE